MSSPRPKIGILGAGPAGLTLASLLTKNNIPFTIFDLRPPPLPSDIASPSGSLDLHEESGLLALQSCGFSERFHELTGECSEDMRVADMHGSVKYQDFGNGKRPEIARNSLSQLLLDSIPQERFRWEHKIFDVQPVEDGKRWRLDFATSRLESNQQTELFDFVIGADGAWSKVRPALTDTKPYASGMNCITLTIPHLSLKNPHLAKMVGQGSYSACAEDKAVMTQRGSLESVRIYLMIKSPPSSDPTSWLTDSGLDSMAVEDLKYQLLHSPELFKSWSDEIKELISVGCDAEKETGAPISAKPLYMLPPHHIWTHRSGATLLGDAAHLMTPFAGEGVNAAMLDALELSQAIIKTYPSSLDAGVEEYEKAMFPRAKEIMEETERNMAMIFSKDSPKEFVEFFKRHLA